eukprot:TRINITY_DN10975_c0_g1_i1.p1 TRINITY_DN10975_c0_g1~~TRINITY_DN10975_c0_g1_i1.p1  ORF type:complete len:676 (+),score=145.64 TRINITY_DN10975_c0_g1_i1:94-2121(+)
MCIRDSINAEYGGFAHGHGVNEPVGMTFASNLTDLDVISLMAGEEAAHVVHLQIEHAKYPTMGWVRAELASLLSCLPEAMMMMYGGVEVNDDWRTDETIPGRRETIVVLPTDHRQAILRHMKRTDGESALVVPKILPLDASMQSAFGKTQPLAWRERFETADWEMRVAPGTAVISNDPKIEHLISSQLKLSKKMTSWEQQKYNICNMRQQERYVLLAQIQQAVATIYRENQFLRDVIVSGFKLEPASAPLPVLPPVEDDYDDDDASICSSVPDTPGRSRWGAVQQHFVSRDKKRKQAKVRRLVESHARMRSNPPLRRVWELKVMQRQEVKSYLRNFIVWLPLMLILITSCYVRRIGLEELNVLQNTLRYTFDSSDLIVDDYREVHANGVGQIYSIPTVDTMYQSWNQTLLGSLFGPPTLPDIQLSPTGAARKYNYVVGGMRWRTLRVKSDSCDVPSQMQPYYPTCFSEYSEGLLSQDNYGDQLQYAFEHESSLQMSPVTGQVATYFGGGYVVDVPPNRSSFAVLESMRQAGFVDEATRAVIVDFAVYNGPLNQFLAVRLLYELPSTGGVMRNMKMLLADVHRFDTGVKVCSAIMSFAVVVYCYWFLDGEIKQTRALGLKYLIRSLSDLWTVLEWINVAMILAQVILRLKVLEHSRVCVSTVGDHQGRRGVQPGVA